MSSTTKPTASGSANAANAVDSANAIVLHVEASGDVGAPAAAVYRLIADYNTEHQRIVPPKYFRNLRAESGGYGDGTVIAYDMITFGKTNHARARVSEPEPGRKLVETVIDQPIITTFTVEPRGAFGSRVTIATEISTRTGVLGWIERAVARSFLTRVYAAELARIEEQAKIGA